MKGKVSKMAKSNKNNRKNTIDQLKEQYGQNLWEVIRPDNVEKSVIRIFVDIARGNIDPDKYYADLTNPVLVDVARRVSYNKYLYYAGIQECAKYAMANKPDLRLDGSVYTAIDVSNTASMNAFSVIYEAFTAVYINGNISELCTLVMKLKPFKYNIK